MSKPREVPIPTTTLSMEELIALGYRKVSNAYCTVARIDRPDWLGVLASSMSRSVMDFCNEQGTVRGSWADHYRRCFSTDTHVVSLDMIGAFPTSSFDPVGYVVQAGEVVPATPSDEALRDFWRENGGSFFGPNIETGSMPESKLLPFLRRLLGGTEEIRGNPTTVASGAPERVV